MNIALFPSAYFPSLGGVEELTRQLAMELIRQGHHVIVLTNRWPRDLPARETIDGIPVYRFAQRVPDGAFKAKVSYRLTHNLIVQRMLLTLHENKINMLHVQCVSSNAHYAMIAQDRLKLPLVVTLQGELTMDASKLFERSEFARALMRRSIAAADILTACSNKTLADAESFYGKPLGPKASVIYNGVNLKEFEEAGNTEHDDSPRRHEDTKDDERRGIHKEVTEENGGMFKHDDSSAEAESADKGVRLVAQPAGREINSESFKTLSDAPYRVSLSDAQQSVSLSEATPSVSLKPPQAAVSLSGRGRAPRPYVFALGRLAPQKAFDVLIKAFALSGVGQSHDLRLAGDGPEKERLAALIIETGQQESIKLIGRADRKQVASLLRGCEFFVVPSPAEPFGIVVIEAMAAGAPVIAINNAGPKEIITHGTNGLLVDRSEPELLAAAITQLCTDNDLRHRLATAGKNRAADFSWPKIVPQYEAAYAAAAAAAQ